jgi:2-dehydro-3-deoxyphosphogluconate aldolase/(4S)-4-hydroxy-2-oxoglutarate aldolase
VSADNLGDWYRSGAVAVGAGSELCPAAAMAAGDWDGIEETARRFARALQAVPESVRAGTDTPS